VSGRCCREIYLQSKKRKEGSKVTGRNPLAKTSGPKEGARKRELLKKARPQGRTPRKWKAILREGNVIRRSREKRKGKNQSSGRKKERFPLKRRQDENVENVPSGKGRAQTP